MLRNRDNVELQLRYCRHSIPCLCSASIEQYYVYRNGNFCKLFSTFIIVYIKIIFHLSLNYLLFICSGSNNRRRLTKMHSFCIHPIISSFWKIFHLVLLSIVLQRYFVESHGRKEAM